MKIFLSALESKANLPQYLTAKGVHMKYNLMSFYAIRPNKFKRAEYIRDHSEEILIDSGAHSFQKGKKVEWETYTRQYAEFIQKFDRPNVLGYFEMDVDNMLGYDKVLELRKILTGVSDKIIPVWHINRGIADYKKMCEEYAGKIVAITGFKNADIRDDQYLMFLKYARRCGCKLHCLGMTRKEVLDKVPFDYVDSSSWLQRVVYGEVLNHKGKVLKEFSSENRETLLYWNYMEGVQMQKHYLDLWRNV